MCVCPYCGGRGEIDEKAIDVLTPIQRKIFTAILSKKEGRTMRQLINAVYADRIDGGPEFAETSLHVAIRNMNALLKLKGFPERVRSSHPRGGAGAVYKVYTNDVV